MIQDIPSTPFLDCISLSVYTCVGYDIVDPHSYSLPMLLSLYYEGKNININSRILIPLPGTFLYCDVFDCYPNGGILSKDTKVQFVYPENKHLPNHSFNKSVHHLIDAIFFTLGLKSLGNNSIRINGALVCGGSGSGKTTILNEIVRMVNSSIPHSAIYTTANDIEYTFSRNSESADSIRVVCVDDIEEGMVPSKFFIELFSQKIIVVAGVSSLNAIPSYLRKDDSFNHVLILSPPTQEERRVMFHKSIQEESLREKVVQYTSGYSYHDIHRLTKQFVMEAFHHEMKDDDYIEILRSFTPSSLVGFDVRKPRLSLKDIGGYKEQKEQLYRLLSIALRKRNVQSFFSMDGMLLYGPTGCGKSIIIPAVIGELQSYYIHVESTSLLSRYFSETEAKLRTVFALARSVAPCVVVIDELDVLAGKRVIQGSNNDGGLSERVITTLLTELDGVDNANSGVTVIGIVNDIDKLDDAIIRPGRLGSHIFMGLPSLEDREEILKNLSSKMPCAADVDFHWLAEHTDQCSGAKLAFLCVKAGLCAMRSGQRCVHFSHFKQSIEENNSL